VNETAAVGARVADVEIAVAGVRRRKPQAVATPPASEHATSERIPRISRLMALAIKLDAMIARGEVRDYADLARLGYVTRARVTQIMSLLHLAPDLQERILFEADVVRNKVVERELRHVVAEVDWQCQRQIWDSSPRNAPS
jgi:hypothetical protein